MVFPHKFRSEHTETKTTSSQYGAFYEQREHARIKLEPDLAEMCKYVDDYQETYIESLKEFVAYPSVSGCESHRKDIDNCIGYVEKWLNKLKIKYECFDIGWQKFNGLCYKLPVCILGSYIVSPRKKTLLVYANLDVTNPNTETWDTDPFTLIEKDKTLYGKGVASGKGPLMCWFNALKAYQENKIALPVNLKFIIESQRQQNHDGLENLIRAQKAKFFTRIDSVIICDSEWLDEFPCLIYGQAGTCRFEITVEKVGDSNPKQDIKTLFSTIVNENNKIIIPQYHKDVEPVTPAEESLYDTIHFDFEEIRPTLPPDKKHWDKAQMLMHFWRFPDIAVGDDEMCDCQQADTTTVKRRFILKIVPRQFPERVAELITSHVYEVCKQIDCQSKVVCEMVYGARPWITDFYKPIYEAARKATIQIYKEDPDLIREDRELTILLMLQRLITDNILMLPLTRSGCQANKENENITIKNYLEGTKLLIAFIKQYAQYLNLLSNKNCSII